MAGVKRDTITESRLLNRAIPTRGAGLVGYIPNATDAVGRTVADKLAEVYSVKDFGAVGDGMADDTWAIQSAINAVVASGQMGVVYIPSGVYRITSGLVVDCGYVSIYGYGAKIDASGMTSGTAMRIHGTALPSFRQICSSIEGIQLIGTNQNNTADGLLIAGTGSHDAANLTIRNCYIDGFANGIRFGNNAYLIGFYSTDVRHCAKAIYVPSSIGNAMENVCFIKCTFRQSTRLVDHQHGGLYFYGCSLDHWYDDCIYINGARLFMYGCHIEHQGTFTEIPIAVHGHGGRLEMFGGSIGTTSSTGDVPAQYIVNCDESTDGGGVFIYGTTLNAIKTQTLRFATGNGLVVTEHVGFVQQWNMCRILGEGQNRLADGGFELANIVDNWFITADTQPVTSRTNGTNIDLALSSAHARTGSKSLQVTTGSGAQARSAVAVPIKPGAVCNYECYYKKPGAETGRVFFRDYHAILGVNADGVPTIMHNSSAISTRTANFTSGAVDWTMAYGIHTCIRSPHWATHYVVEVDLDEFRNASFYIDDFIISVM
ncbi:MAG TPA: glycosyl hydrolase family 28-related protein [Bacillota bacterium]|nr:glycosyl hydrolase family 28-related protein [Bacillota bacterium]